MDDLEQRIRDARPDIGSRHDPLSLRAQTDLESILATPPVRRRPRWVLPVAWSTGAVAALAAIVTVVSLTVAPQPSMAAPPVLEATPIDEPLAEVLARLSAHAQHLPEPPREVERIRYEAWFGEFFVDDEKKTSFFVQPTEVTLEHHADLSGSITTRAGEVRWGHPSPDNPSLKPGSLIETLPFGPGEFPLVHADAPPTSVAAFREYLAAAGWGDTATTGELFAGVQEVAAEWGLDGAQTATIIDFLAGLPGVEVAGRVTDRLGREGIALQTETRAGGGFRDTLVFDPNTGRLLASEQTYLGGVDGVDLPIPSVVSYMAWKASK